MKFAITGKGGVGKTTIAAGLARAFSIESYKVIAIDADPDANLATALGLSADKAMNITPISKMSELISERTGSTHTTGGFFKLNPKVDDLPEELSVEINGVKLMLLGTIEKGGSGCICPENSLLRALLKHLIIDRKEVVILDMEAGIEHLGRSTAESVDALIIVVEPGQRSIQTAKAIEKLARDLSVKNVFLVANKINNLNEKEVIKKHLQQLPIIGTVLERNSIRLADLEGKSPFEADKSFVEEILKIKDYLTSKIGFRESLNIKSSHDKLCKSKEININNI